MCWFEINFSEYCFLRLIYVIKENCSIQEVYFTWIYYYVFSLNGWVVTVENANEFSEWLDIIEARLL